jgi:TonB family protein
MSAVLAATKCLAGNATPEPPVASQFEIGRLTFFDFGPPFDYYEVLRVRPTAAGSEVERIVLTPPGDACFQPAKVEDSSALTTQSISQLLAGTNPCAISEKELQRELKRKKGPVFSGVIVTMRVQCGSQTRTIHADILDRDLFDPAPNTPKHTSWTMSLLQRLDHVLGPGVMEKPVFSGLPGFAPENENQPKISASALQELSSGDYDALFAGAKDKPSELYAASQRKPPTPSVELVDSSPLQPQAFAKPKYPPLARAARIEGRVVVKLEVDQAGVPSQVTIESGHPMLKGTVEESAKSWRFPEGAADRQVIATVGFRTNCPKSN